MDIITHEMTINVEDNSYTVKPPLDIHQGDYNRHLLLMQLVNSDKEPYELKSESKAKLTFYRDDQTEILSTDAVITVNPYRGILSYLVGPELVKVDGRVTVYLYISLDPAIEVECECGPSASFVMTISKVHGYQVDPDDIDATISVGEKKRILEHIAPDMNLHLSPLFKEFLDAFADRKDELEKLLDTDWDKFVEDKINEVAGDILRRAFITVDYYYPYRRDPNGKALSQLTYDDLCDGKLVRVNHDNSEDPTVLGGVSYYEAVYDDDLDTYSWMKTSIGGKELRWILF